MAFKLAEAFVQFGSKGFTTVEAHIAKIKRGLFELSSAGGLTTAISLTGLVAGLFKSVAAAEEADKAQRRLHATIRLMGEEAGITAQEINAIAGSLANASEFDDDAIAKATVSMLEFGNIAPSMLKRAIPVAIDLAARNGDLEGTFKALGAALDDPVNSIGLLRRQYRALSADVLKAVEELAKSGDVVGAQRMILDELAKKSQGLAAAMVTPLDKAKNALSEMAESVGTALAPTIEWFAKGAKSVADFYAELARGEQGISLDKPRGGKSKGGGLLEFLGISSQTGLGRRKPVDDMEQELRDAQERASKGSKRLGATPDELRKEEETNAEFVRQRRAAAEKDRAKMLADIEAENLEGPEGERAKFMQALENRISRLKELYASEVEIERTRANALRKFEDEQRSKAFTKQFGNRPSTFKGVAALAGAGGGGGGGFLAQGDLFKSLMESVAPDSDRNPIRRRLEIEFNAADFERQVNQRFGPDDARRQQLKDLIQQNRDIEQEKLTDSTRKAPEFVGVAEMAKRIQQLLSGGDTIALEKRQTELLRRIQELSQGAGLNVNIRNIRELEGLGAVGI
jgi:hypothetical protein